MNEQSIVLDAFQIQQKTERIALEIIETTLESPTLFLVGIAGNGYTLAKRLVVQLNRHSEQQVALAEMRVRRDGSPDDEVPHCSPPIPPEGATIILVDDVIHSGKTSIHAVRNLLNNRPRILKIAALVSRTHRKFPVHADFVGLHISTTLQNNIRVELGQKEVVYLE